MQSPEANARGAQKQQADRVTSYKPTRPEMPGDNMCPGGHCSEEVPPPPSGSLNESYRNMTKYPMSWLIVVGVASVAFALLSVPSFLKKR